jgi:two-component system sensor histidine kinase TctE
LTRSLAGRLVLATVVTSLVCSAVLIGALLVIIDRRIDTLRDRSLQGQATDVARYLNLVPDGQPVLALPPALKASYDAAGQAYVFTVVAPDGRVAFASDGRARPLAQQIDRAKPTDYFTYRAPGGATYYGASFRKMLGGQAWLVQVAQGPDHRDVLADSLLDELFEEAAWPIVVFCAAILIANLVVVRRSLRPVCDVSEQAAAIGPQRTDIRLDTANVPRELLPLIVAVNSAFDRLEHGIAVQRAFTADAAHELRTPLAILHAGIDEIEDAAVRGSLKADIARLESLATQLLRLSRIEGMEPAGGETADLFETAQEVARQLAPMAVRQGRALEIDWRGGALPVAGSADAVEAALRNLVENALNHTPPGTPVEIRLDDTPAVSVIDHGPGIPPALRETVFQRFWRGKGAGPDRGGAGLGLSIVARAAERLGGSVAISDTPGGGATFTMTLQPPVRLA